jgi:serine/threonine protein phosphatase 1
MRTLVIGYTRRLTCIAPNYGKSQGHQRRYSDFLGDYVDGWSQSPGSRLLNLNTTNNCVFIRGNHDELLLHWLRDSKDNLMWYKHGGEATVLMKSQFRYKTITC